MSIEINYQILTLVTALAAPLLAVFVKEYFDKKSTRLKHVMDKVSEEHKRLCDRLGDILRDGQYSFLSIPDQLTEEDIQVVNSSYDNYKKEYDANTYAKFEEFSKRSPAYDDLFERFSKMILPDLRKISGQSTPHIQKLVTEVINLYGEVLTKKEELRDALENAEIGTTLLENGVTKSYLTSSDKALEKIFLIKAKNLLLKIEKGIEKVFKL